MLKEVRLDYQDKDAMLKILRALSNESRINILELLTEHSLNVNEIAEKLSIPMSTAALSVRILEDAGLIFTELQPGVRGSKKLCSRYCDKIQIELYPGARMEQDNFLECSMPVGNYIDFQLQPTCGMAGVDGSIGIDDDPSSFYLPDHVSAQILWFCNGYVEYRFPNHFQSGRPEELSVSFEVCSEAPFYRNEWPSDITVWINSVPIGTWTSPGDFGGRRGKYNPQWWPDTLNQYGELKQWTIDAKGSRLDGEQISDVTLDKLGIEKAPYISLRIGNADNAVNQGGVSLFGKKFGDYPQDILMLYKLKK